MAKGRGQKVNRAELAAVFGVSLPTVDAWVRAGCPYDVKGQGKGRPWVFDTADVAAWREERARAEGNGEEVADAAAYKLRREKAATLREELALAKDMREVAPLEEIERKLARVFAEVRTNLRNIPGRVAPQLLGETDERKFKVAMLKEIDATLTRLAELDLSAEDDAEDGEDADADD